MNTIGNPSALKAAATYNAAADHFDEAPLSFWDRHGRRVVELLALRPGGQVLDAGCGTGASALPAAAAVGPEGRVTGIDVAENMLERGRAKARARGLGNVSFALADMSASGLPDGSFDAVISVFSVFFVPDTERQVAEFWRKLRPSGQLAVTVWGSGAFEPGAAVFGEEVRRLRPGSPVATRPWERLTDPDNLRRLLLDGGTTEPAIEPVADRQPLSHPEDWWTIAMGSGYRWEIDQLSADQRTRVRARTVERLSGLAANSIGTSAIHAIARKPR